MLNISCNKLVSVHATTNTVSDLWEYPMNLWEFPQNIVIKGLPDDKSLLLLVKITTWHQEQDKSIIQNNDSFTTVYVTRVRGGNVYGPGDVEFGPGDGV